MKEMVKFLKAALDVAKTLFSIFIDIVIDSMSFFIDAYDLFCFSLISKLFGRFYFRNQFLVPFHRSELIPDSIKKQKVNKFVYSIFECFRKATVQIKRFYKWCIYIIYRLFNYLVVLIFKLDVCVILVCMLIYK